MPIFWKYLLKHFFKVFFNCTLAFIIVLLVTRLEEIAKIAAYGANIYTLILFTLHQIPYILPIVLPLSGLIASFLLFSNLSKNQEFTAFRSSGLSLRQILAPILIISFFLGIANFYITSELATQSHLKTRRIAGQLALVNPLLLLQDKKLLRYQNAYVEMNSGVNKETVEDLLLFSYSEKTDHINMIRADKLQFKDQQITGERVSFVNVAQGDSLNGFDHIIIENQKKIATDAQNLNYFFRRSGWRLSNDHLKARLLLAKYKSIKKELKSAQTLNQSKEAKITLSQINSEAIRRISLGFAVFSFCLLGSAFSMRSQRSLNRIDFYALCLLTATFLICFFLAKSLDRFSHIVATLHIGSHFMLLFPSCLRLYNLSKGRK
ncbi:hypothetical protein AB751O23_AZ_00070 [Chlamydiales bacterium SCGC AB-751-O23]|jgi:lipopolysaccharide export system permease protein|nr:hypothetical protein AB751O23_AZ_00070 [Chlamydiales bacterium SCGC AB-751-O23]